MMVLIGVRDSNGKNGKILDSKCPKCQSANSLDFSIYRRYTHLTLIPLFPVGKFVYIKCSCCNEFLDYEDLTEKNQLQLKNEKLKNSIWMFSGILILICALVYGINYYLNIKNETLNYINNPKRGDIYNLKDSNGYYSTMRIDNLTNDSIYGILNDYNAYLPTDLSDIDIPENYSNKKVKYSKKDLYLLKKNNQIFSITRKKK
jgi:ribosomal protein S27E